MEQFFKLKEHGTDVKTEVAAGITTFMTMAYILIVNAGIFSDLGTVSYGAIYIATAVSAAAKASGRKTSPVSGMTSCPPRHGKMLLPASQRYRHGRW